MRKIEGPPDTTTDFQFRDTQEERKQRGGSRQIKAEGEREKKEARRAETPQSAE